MTVYEMMDHRYHVLVAAAERTEGAVQEMWYRKAIELHTRMRSLSVYDALQLH